MRANEEVRLACPRLHASAYVRMYVCMYVCMYVRTDSQVPGCVFARARYTTINARACHFPPPSFPLYHRRSPRARIFRFERKRLSETDIFPSSIYSSRQYVRPKIDVEVIVRKVSVVDAVPSSQATVLYSY